MSAPPDAARRCAGMHARGSGRLLARTALVFASVILAVLLAELVLRTTGYPRQDFSLICHHPVIGNVFCPDTVGLYANELGGSRWIAIDGHGLVDNEHKAAKAGGIFRIALLGDSVVAGLDVAAHERIARLWESMLRGRLGQRIEVIDFSMPGTGTWEQLQRYHLQVRAFRPDLVVLAFYWGNDLWNNAARLNKGGNNPLYDDYAVGSEQRVRVLHRAVARWLRHNSLVYQVARRGYAHLAELRRQAAMHGWGSAVRMAGARSAPASLAHLTVMHGMPEYDWDSPDWTLTRELIAKLAREVRSDGSALAVFQIPALIHARDRLPRASFEAFLARQGIPVFGLFDLYDRQTQAEYLAQFIAGDVHWTAAGHAAAARHTATALGELVERLGRQAR